MKLYEFVDKLYAMGDMEAPKTIRSKKALNESYSTNDESLLNEAATKKTLQDYLNNNLTNNVKVKSMYVHPGHGYRTFEIDLTPEQYNNNGYGYMFDFIPKETSEDRFYDYVLDSLNKFIEDNLAEDDLEEGILGGLAGAAIGGLAGNSLGHPILGAIGGGLAGSAIQNALNDDLDEESEGEEQLNEETEEVTEDKDLSTVKGSMTKILQDNREKIDACSSAQEVRDVVAGLLAEAGLDTQATRRLLLTLKKQRGLTGALQAVYNSILKGSNLGVK